MTQTHDIRVVDGKVTPELDYPAEADDRFDEGPVTGEGTDSDAPNADDAFDDQAFDEQASDDEVFDDEAAHDDEAAYDDAAHDDQTYDDDAAVEAHSHDASRAADTDSADTDAADTEELDDAAEAERARADEAALLAEAVADGAPAPTADEAAAIEDVAGAIGAVDQRRFVGPSSAVIDERTYELILEKAATAGPIVDDPGTKVRYRRMAKVPGTLWTWLVASVTLILSVAYAIWLIRSGPPIENRVMHAINLAAAIVVVVMLVIETLRLLLIAMLSMSTSLVRAPIPVLPHRNLKTAVFVTFVPASESLSMLEETLTAAKRLEVPAGTQAGPDDDPALVDVFVLDEGDPNDPDRVQAMIDRLNAEVPGNTVRRISRYGIEKYHRGKKFATKTKHGNVNAAYEMICEDPELPRYDVLIGLDPDHVPMPELTTRLIGYFNDPNVAYVAAPQAYANSTVSVVPKLAESQQFVFHSLIQTSANSYGGSMLVGTNYAIRTAVFEQIGGAQPSITEDLATGLKAISARNPETGGRWHSVYTPDVLAHGEGPDTWGAYFKQQNRWATGAIRHVIAGPFIWQMLKTWYSPRRVLHYSLLMAFYPVMAITWILGAVNAAVFALYGESGTVVDPAHWVLFYTWTIIAQITLFIVSRRFNVSPYESDNSWGVYGMFMSVAAAPIYVVAMLKSLVTANPKFDVTPKGKSAKKNRDSLFTFRWNIIWAALFIAIIWRISAIGYASVATLAWPVIALFLSISPIIIWAVGAPKRRRLRRAAEAAEAAAATGARTVAADPGAQTTEARTTGVQTTGTQTAGHPDAGTTTTGTETIEHRNGAVRTGTAAEILGATKPGPVAEPADGPAPEAEDADEAPEAEDADDDSTAVEPVQLVHSVRITEIERPAYLDDDFSETEDGEFDDSDVDDSVFADNEFDETGTDEGQIPEDPIDAAPGADDSTEESTESGAERVLEAR